jgi:hypothetical protein
VSLPVPVGFELINHHGPVLSTVSREVSLPVTIDIQTPRHDSSGNGPFPDGGVNHFPLPLDVTRETDID